ncbi:MAG: prolipoprotein diacylglyceryl transferase [Flavobacteriales bacterium]|nr:prolipoprotein diacylglyceryl transferase [Flavobacteriales bacterium]
MNFLPLYIVWDIDPVAIPIGDGGFNWYGLMWSAGFVAGYYVAAYIFKQEGYNKDKITNMLFYTGIGGIVGARLADIVFYNLDYFIENPSEIGMIWKGGLASHGGVPGVIIGAWLFTKFNKEFKLVWLLDRLAIISLIGLGLVRIGNLCNSELYGIPTDVPWAFIFYSVDDLPRHPVQIYEALMCWGVFAYLLYTYKRVKNNMPGLYLTIFFIFIFSIRLLLEFFKEREPGLINIEGLSNTQLLSVPMIILGIISLILMQKGYYKKWLS